ncbi:MAG: phosphoribosylformylglycinamidine cyclo-ligase [bacterium]|nr:phosphoribosylformylglycinamidine cyclo-ligase [bacterium]
MADRITYKDAGVNIDAGKEAVGLIKDAVRSTHGSRVLGGIGGFGGMYLRPDDQNVLIQSIDRVGAIIKVAIDANNCGVAGEALVNHSVNGILVHGARPLTFLDYFAAGVLNKQQMAQAVIGATNACRALNVSMTGGETAEMPGFYMPGIFDLAGCITGIVDKSKLVTGKAILVSDVLVGLASNGLHTNGWSLVRKVLEKVGLTVDDPAPWNPESTVGKALLTGHRCYFDALYPLFNLHLIRGAAHITGGGIPDNLVRVLPKWHRAIVDYSSWERDAVFDWIQQASGNSRAEMLKTFNMKVGMIIVVRREDVSDVLQHLNSFGERAWVIGKIVQGHKGVKVV